ncbi:bifunctional transcriptional activator/DNA repair enzyme AdaA [Streptomyces roseifaciens]|uniref:bifunctional transcriptional activator/DNA repair enzyme AdaA n=1 Tax=Streptomyces roseifaciens TaxID=1488406 RepID=UPI000717F25D|nr:AlkA N-terminal domain-containing protein [Streptomyces roseifaciens]
MLDFDSYYRAMASRDARFDGSFYVAVTTTGVYCRPVCGSRTPKPENVRFFRIAAAAEAAGFRACRRCRPEAAPSSPEWNVRGDLVARALRLIAGGAVDEVGVAGVARQLAVSERHLHRQLVAEVGVGPLALALNRRTQVARLLIESSALLLSEVALAAGYSSVRQFNDGMRAAFGCSPTELRRACGARADQRAGERAPGRSGPLVLRLRYRPPFDGEGILAWLRERAVPGVEETEGNRYRRTLRLPRGSGTAELDLTVAAAARGRTGQQHVTLRLTLADLRDVTAAVRRCRDLLDLDADPAAIGEALRPDPWIGPLVRAAPGLRMPGCTHGFEPALRVVLEQFASLAEVRAVCTRMAAHCGEPVAAAGEGRPCRLFPSAQALADADPDAFGLAGRPAAAVRALAGAVAEEKLSLERDADREETAARLRELPGVSGWAVQRIAMHALGDPDAFAPQDPQVRAAAKALGLAGARDAGRLAEHARAWQPWRSYAALHLRGAAPVRQRAL